MNALLNRGNDEKSNKRTDKEQLRGQKCLTSSSASNSGILGYLLHSHMHKLVKRCNREQSRTFPKITMKTLDKVAKSRESIKDITQNTDPVLREQQRNDNFVPMCSPRCLN